MRRFLGTALVMALVLVACGDGGVGSNEAATSTSDSSPAQTTSSLPTSTSQTTAGPTSSSSTTSPERTTTTLPDIGDLPTGLYCRDLVALGYTYQDAVGYWTREGRPSRMDADWNSIPCETVYAESEVRAFWGDPLPTSTTVPTWTIEAIEQRLAALVDDTWACEVANGVALGGGAVVKCVPSPRVDEGEYPVYTGLVLDSRGTVAFAQSGLLRTSLNTEFLYDYLEPGQYCRDILPTMPEELDTPELRYFAAVLYWFMEGMPDRMDADQNGIPCETLVSESVVDTVWGGGLVD